MDSMYISIIGSGLTISSKCEQLIGLEFPEVRIFRAGGLAELDGQHAGTMRLALIEQEAYVRFGDDLVREVLSSAADSVLLAYLDEAVALQFLDEVRAQAESDSSHIGVLPMNLQLDCWTSMLRLAFLGQCCVPQAFLSQRGKVEQPAPVKKMMRKASKLTPRERQILELVARGKQNKLIAVDLDLSEHTVKLHMHHIITKLGVRNRTEAAGVFLGMSQ